MFGRRRESLRLQLRRTICKEMRSDLCVLITKYNKPVTNYGLQRSRLFALIKKQQLFWIESEDSLPKAHFGDLSTQELQELKRKWNHYHARRSEGILSFTPATYDLPVRVTNIGNATQFKKHGVHKGTLCRMRAWTLHSEDMLVIESRSDPEIC